MKDAGIFQRQKIELLTPGPSALPRSAMRSETTPMVIRNPSIQRNIADPPKENLPMLPNSSTTTTSVPLEQGRRRSFSEVQEDEKLAHATIIIHKLDSDPPLAECVWDVNGHLQNSPDPAMIISQYAIYSINNFFLLTVSKDFIAEPTKVQSDSEKRNRKAEWTNYDIDSNSSGNPWEELKERIRQADADVRVNSSSAKYLAFCAMVRCCFCHVGTWLIFCF